MNNKIAPADINQDIPNVYFRELYLKDLKYISPETVNKRKKIDEIITNTANEANKSFIQKWFSEMFRGLKQFFYEGSLHGVKYIFEPSFGKKERATWIIIMVVSVILCAVNIIQLFCKWSSRPFVNVIDSVPTPIWAVPFPTVVLCPHLHVKLSSFEIKFPNDTNNINNFYASLVCPHMTKITRSQQLDQQQLNDLQKFLVMASPNCTDIIKGCKWPAKHDNQWHKDDCCDLFQPIFTEYGLCYAFNSLPLNGMTNITLDWQKSYNPKTSEESLVWDLDSGYPKSFPPDINMKPRRVKSSGEVNGLTVDLFLNKSEHQYHCDGNSLGFTVLIGAPIDHLYTSTVIRIPMDRMSTIEVSPLTYKTDAPLRGLAPNQRQCFFQTEKILEYYKYYTDTNCQHNTLVTEARRLCDCVLFNWPRKSLQDTVCSTMEDFECIKNVTVQVEDQLIFAYYADSEDRKKPHAQSKSCHPACIDILYSSQVFYSDLISHQESEPSNHNTQHERTQINVHFYEDFFLGQHRHAQYDDYYFAGAIGGLLSLFMGFSIISVVELVYFVMLRPAYVVLKALFYQRKVNN